jgi:tetrahydromethanopterin S-methyltransferase subunit G
MGYGGDMSDISRPEIERIEDRLTKLMHDGFEGVHKRLDVLNGRTGGAEREIAVLKDRSPGRQASIAGGAVSGAIVILWQFLEWASKR